MGDEPECNPELLLLDVHRIVFIHKWVSPLNGENGEPRLNNFLADFSPRLSLSELFFSGSYITFKRNTLADEISLSI